MSHVKCALFKRSQDTFNDYCSYQEHKPLLVQYFYNALHRNTGKITKYLQRIPVCNGMKT